MDSFWIFIAPLLILLFIFRSRKSGILPLPPGPIAWPLVGSWFSLRTPLHYFYGDLAKRYGPVLLVKLGMVSIVVVSSPKAAEELLKLRDSEFAYKPPMALFEYISFNFNDLAFSDPNNSRKLRKICLAHLFSSNKLNVLSSVRSSGVREHVKAIYSNIDNGMAMNLTTRLHELVAHNTFLLLLGRENYSKAKSETIFLRSLLYAIEEEYTKFNIGDIFPPLRRLDLQGMTHKWLHELMPPLTEFLAKKIQEHRRSKKLLEATGNLFEPKCFLDVLISLEGEDALPDIKIMGLLSNLLSGGISTQEETLNWAFAELIRHPEVMAKAQQEIDNVVGKDRFVEDSDLPSLPYISAIVKEILRLHTLVPLGSPHYNPQESQLEGYRIPAKSTVFVNLWALSHDPTLWDQPDEFRPERFMDADIGYIDNFHFLPFMAGRRICVGYSLAMRFIPLVISTLLQSFEWGAAPGQSIGDIDMSAKLAGLNARSEDLLVSISPRLADQVYAE